MGSNLTRRWRHSSTPAKTFFCLFVWREKEKWDFETGQICQGRKVQFIFSPTPPPSPYHYPIPLHPGDCLQALSSLHRHIRSLLHWYSEGSMALLENPLQLAQSSDGRMSVLKGQHYLLFAPLSPRMLVGLGR